MKVLIVDDSKAMRMIVIRALRQAGFRSHTFDEAEDGVAARQALQQAPYDLVLSDWNMPNMTGIELLESLRAEGTDTKFGFVTSEGTASMRDRAMAAGAMFLITKPFTSDVFEDQLSGVL